MMSSANRDICSPYPSWEWSQLATSAFCCTTLEERQHLQSSSYPLQCVQIHFFFSHGVLECLLRKPGLLQMLCHLWMSQVSNIQQFPNHGKERWRPVHRHLLDPQPILKPICHLMHRWARLLPGPLAYGTRFHNFQKTLLFIYGCQILIVRRGDK